MANPYDRGGSRNFSKGGSYGQHRDNTPKPKLGPAPLPEDYVEAAEDVIRAIADKSYKEKITTSKLRNLHSLVIDSFNQEQLRTDSEILESTAAALQRARIRMAYEAGREESTRVFVEEAKLLPYLKGIGTSREKFLNFFHYMEALVAYHRFYHISKD